MTKQVAQDGGALDLDAIEGRSQAFWRLIEPRDAPAVTLHQDDADTIARVLHDDVPALVTLVRAWERVYRARDAYHQHSMTAEWNAYEEALRDLAKTGGPDIRAEQEADLDREADEAQRSPLCSGGCGCAEDLCSCPQPDLVSVAPEVIVDGADVTINVHVNESALMAALDDGGGIIGHDETAGARETVGESDPPALPGEVWRGETIRTGGPWLCAIAPMPEVPGSPERVVRMWVPNPGRWEVASVWMAAEAYESWAAAERQARELFQELERISARVSYLRARGCDGAADEKEEEYGPTRKRLDDALRALGVEP